MRFVVLASGRGSNLRSLLTAVDEERCAATPVAVLSDRRRALALTLAEERGLATDVVPLKKGDCRDEWNRRLADAIARHSPDLVVLAGFMKLLGAPVLERFAGRIVNVHPSILPAFPGKDSPAQAVAAGVRLSGCTVHVVDEGVDTGPVLAQAAVPVLPDDDADTLHARIQVAEHALLPAVVDAVGRGALVLGGGPGGLPQWSSVPTTPAALLWPAEAR